MIEPRPHNDCGDGAGATLQEGGHMIERVLRRQRKHQQSVGVLLVGLEQRAVALQLQKPRVRELQQEPLPPLPLAQTPCYALAGGVVVGVGHVQPRECPHEGRLPRTAAAQDLDLVRVRVLRRAQQREGLCRHMGRGPERSEATGPPGRRINRTGLGSGRGQPYAML